jgi:hypothetical protein
MVLAPAAAAVFAATTAVATFPPDSKRRRKKPSVNTSKGFYVSDGYAERTLRRLRRAAPLFLAETAAAGDDRLLSTSIEQPPYDGIKEKRESEAFFPRPSKEETLVSLL